MTIIACKPFLAKVSPTVFSTLALTTIVFISSAIFAQSPEKIIRYFDSEGKVISDSANATYYRTVEEKHDSLYVIRDYFISGKLQMFVECSSYRPQMTKNGKCVFYYENGQIQQESHYVNGDRVGIFKSYYDSGKPCIVTRHAPEKATTYIHYYSPEGAELLPRGNGIVSSPPYEGDTYPTQLEIKDSIMVGSFYIEPTKLDTIYYVTEVRAEYPGGPPALSKYISTSINYPKSAKNAGLEGTALVGFTIDKQGNVTDCKLVKGFFKSCDDEALIVVCTMKNWEPAKHHGKVVASKYVQPVKFRLNY